METGMRRFAAEAQDPELRGPRDGQILLSHKSDDIWWYYYVYGSYRDGPRNKIAERCIGRRVNGDVAVVKSGPEEASNYPDEFTRTDLVKTAAFYHTEDPSSVFGEREGARASIKYGIDLTGVPKLHHDRTDSSSWSKFMSDPSNINKLPKARPYYMSSTDLSEVD
ncbi:hypothetical protein BJY00DRAFT_308079 [Aspergillus carlsbadensis]|nr:hypothetical protein BJY00DRAFT_308079 [Aspergillus carlsbadensis]